MESILKELDYYIFLEQLRQRWVKSFIRPHAEDNIHHTGMDLASLPLRSTIGSLGREQFNLEQIKNVCDLVGLSMQ